MFYRFPDEYFFPVEQIDDLYFEEIGYRHVVVEDNEFEGKAIIEENEAVIKILGKDKEDIMNFETLSFEEYSIQSSTRSIALFEEFESNDNSIVNEIELKDEADISEEIKDSYEGKIIDEFDDNLTRQDDYSEMDNKILEESDEVYSEEEVAEERIIEVENEKVEENKENDIGEIEVEIL